MLNLLDDTPIVPGDTHPVFDGSEVARQVLNDAEDELRSWQPNLEPIHSSAGSLGAGAMPGSNVAGSDHSHEQEVLDYRERTARSRSNSGEKRGVNSGSPNGGEVQPPYPMTEAERREVEHAGMI